MNVVAHIYEWFHKARLKQVEKTKQVQMGVHFEEISEMLQEISTDNPETDLLISKAKQATHNLAEHLKNGEPGLVYINPLDRKNYLDALADQVVTAVGCAYDADFAFTGALEEVDRSNWSKFVDGQPIFDANGKIAKGPNYTKPDLSQFV